MKYPDLMVDLETLGNGSRAAVIQIGAAAFDLEAGMVGPKFSVLVKADLRKFEADLSTVAWWMTQNEGARDHVALCYDMGVSEEEALMAFVNYVDIYTQNGVQVWAMPPQFDLVVLENLMSVCRVRPPWKYNATRDLRTLERLTNNDWSHRIQPTVPHDAGEDAVAQAHTAIKYYQQLFPK